MELTTSHALQGLIMLATIASGYAIVKHLREGIIIATSPIDENRNIKR